MRSGLSRLAAGVFEGFVGEVVGLDHVRAVIEVVLADPVVVFGAVDESVGSVRDPGAEEMGVNGKRPD